MPVNSKTDKAIDYIKSNWKKGGNLKQVALLHGLDPGNLARAFRTREGVTAKKYVDSCRKMHLLEQISRTQRLGFEIGAELGFVDDLAFYRWVKRAFGIPLTELRGTKGR